jgi:predicted Zn-dependent protease
MIQVMVRARVALGALSVIACAWFVLGVRQAHEIGAATAIVSQQGPLRPAQVSQARSRLNAAGTLNPDLEVDVLRARLVLDLGDPPGARAILDSVVRREPQNLEAWIWLARAARGDPATFKLAIARIDELIRTVPAAR